MTWEGLADDERPAAEAEVAAAQPLKRDGRPEEIAQVARFLASDEALPLVFNRKRKEREPQV